MTGPSVAAGLSPTWAWTVLAHITSPGPPLRSAGATPAPASSSSSAADWVCGPVNSAGIVGTLTLGSAPGSACCLRLVAARGGSSAPTAAPPAAPPLITAALTGPPRVPPSDPGSVAGEEWRWPAFAGAGLLAPEMPGTISSGGTKGPFWEPSATVLARNGVAGGFSLGGLKRVRFLSGLAQEPVRRARSVRGVRRIPALLAQFSGNVFQFTRGRSLVRSQPGPPAVSAPRRPFLVFSEGHVPDMCQIRRTAPAPRIVLSGGVSRRSAGSRSSHPRRLAMAPGHAARR